MHRTANVSLIGDRAYSFVTGHWSVGPSFEIACLLDPAIPVATAPRPMSAPAAVSAPSTSMPESASVPWSIPVPALVPELTLALVAIVEVDVALGAMEVVVPGRVVVVVVVVGADSATVQTFPLGWARAGPASWCCTSFLGY